MSEYQEKKDKNGRSYYVGPDNKRVSKQEYFNNVKNVEKEFEPTAVKVKRQAEEARQDVEETAVQPDDNQPSSTAPPLPEAQTIDPNLIAQVVATVQALQAQNPQVAQATPEQKLKEIESMSTARVSDRGVQGVVSKYSVEKDYYPDPTERLLNEPSLARYAMKENYIFRWNVDGVEYERNGVAYSEPRFTIELFRRLYDDDGNPTGTAALVARNMLHEDQMTTRMAAHRLGLTEKYEAGEQEMRELMDEVRYWRMQQWLFGIFRPPQVETHRKRPTTQVIDGKVVEVFDTESLIDRSKAQTQAATLQGQTGVGDVAVPER